MYRMLIMAFAVCGICVPAQRVEQEGSPRPPIPEDPMFSVDVPPIVPDPRPWPGLSMQLIGVINMPRELKENRLPVAWLIYERLCLPTDLACSLTFYYEVSLRRKPGFEYFERVDRYVVVQDGKRAWEGLAYFGESDPLICSLWVRTNAQWRQRSEGIEKDLDKMLISYLMRELVTLHRRERNKDLAPNYIHV